METMRDGQRQEVLLRIIDLFQVIPLPVGEAPLSLAIALPKPSLTHMPGYPSAALPQSGRVASGRGLTWDRCLASAVGEAAELASCCAWGTEQLVLAPERELGRRAVSADDLNGFSGAQIAGRETWNARYAQFDWRPPPRGADRPAEWLEVEGAYGGPGAYIPADFAFIGRREPGDETAIAIGDSNGCACGADTDSAKLAALLELVERDGAARWWYGRRRRPLLDPARLVEADFKAWLEARPRRTWIVDLTTDLEVPVVAAVSAEPDGRDVALGFAARPEFRDAALDALTEMVQMEFPLAVARHSGAAAGYWHEWRGRVSMNSPPLDAGRDGGTLPEVPHRATSLQGAIEACARRRIRLWFADMTRDALNVPAFRAISPDLCHTKPRFARKRLLAPDRRDLHPALLDPEDQVPFLI